jgi:hypothetical protein
MTATTQTRVPAQQITGQINNKINSRGFTD